MKKRVVKNNYLVITGFILFLGILLAVSLVLASHDITTSTGGTSFTVNEGISTLYNITVNNSDVGQGANITQVNITFSDNFDIADHDTNGTDSASTFSINDLNLSWTNTSGYVINGSEVKHFWINATAINPGFYNITITTTNATGSYSTNISVTVNAFVSECNTSLDISNLVYTLNQSISAWNLADCISIEADNVTLDCNGYTITYGGDDYGYYGIDNEGGYDNITIQNCIISQNSSYQSIYEYNAISFVGSENAVIFNNTITTFGLYSLGIILDIDSTGANITSNTINTSGGYGAGIEVWFGGNNTINNNIIITSGDSADGLDTYYSVNNTLTSNNITTFGANAFGIYLLDGNSSLVYSNTITTTGSGGDGIFIDSESYNNLTNNILNTTNGFAIWVEGLVTQDYNHTVINNTEQGENIYYLFNNDSGIIENENVGEIFVASSNNLTLNNLTLDYDGITFTFTENSTIKNSNIILSGTGLYWGIGFGGSYYNNITNNTITTSGAEVDGIYLVDTNHSVFTLNTISVTGNESYVIYTASSDNNTFYNNIFNASTLGCSLSTSGFGFGGEDNFTGNFIWNMTKTAGTNIVGKSYVGGNYWTNNASTGYSDTCVDSNGDYICEGDYDIATGSFDYLPLSVYTTQVSGCKNITLSNTLHTLNQSFSTTGACVQIKANNITLDFAGFNITGNNVSYGVNITNYDNTTVKHGFVYNFSKGIYLENSQDNNITNMTSNENGINGIYFFNSSNNVLTDITSNSNGADGIYFNSSSNNAVTDTTANNNGGDGIKTESATATNNTLARITVNSNAASGIYPSNSSQLTNITANNNTYGISVGTNDNILINVTANDNSYYGLWLGGNSTGNAITNFNINNSGRDAVHLTGATSSNNLTSITVTNTNSSYYDINFSTAGINGTWIIDTDFASYTFTGIGGLVNFKETSYGAISFLESINGSGTNLSSDIRIGSNSIFVNSSNNIGLNKSANIILYSITYTDPKPQYSSDGTTFVDCTTTTNPACSELGFSGNNFIFNISHFTTFRAAEAYIAPESTSSSSSSGGGTPPYWARTYNVNEDQFTEGYTKELGIKHRMKVKISDEYHYVGLVELTDTTVKINVSSVPQQVTLSAGQEEKFDATGDDYYDISVTLNGISNDKASITIISISEKAKVEEIEQEESGEEIKKSPEEDGEGLQEGKSLAWLWIVMGIILVGVLAGIGYKVRKGRH